MGIGKLKKNDPLTRIWKYKSRFPRHIIRVSGAGYNAANGRYECRAHCQGPPPHRWWNSPDRSWCSSTVGGRNNSIWYESESPNSSCFIYWDNGLLRRGRLTANWYLVTGDYNDYHCRSTAAVPPAQGWKSYYKG